MSLNVTSVCAKLGLRKHLACVLIIIILSICNLVFHGVLLELVKFVRVHIFTCFLFKPSGRVGHFKVADSVSTECALRLPSCS